MNAQLKVIITSKADEDEIKIYQYISEKFGNIYAERFRKNLLELFRLVACQPFIGRPAKKTKTIRVLIFSKQNKLIYKVTDEEIIVLRILNTRTNISKKF